MNLATRVDNNLRSFVDEIPNHPFSYDEVVIHVPYDLKEYFENATSINGKFKVEIGKKTSKDSIIKSVSEDGKPCYYVLFILLKENQRVENGIYYRVYLNHEYIELT